VLTLLRKENAERNLNLDWLELNDGKHKHRIQSRIKMTMEEWKIFREVPPPPLLLLSSLMRRCD